MKIMISSPIETAQGAAAAEGSASGTAAVAGRRVTAAAGARAGRGREAQRRDRPGAALGLGARSTSTRLRNWRKISRRARQRCRTGAVHGLWRHGSAATRAEFRARRIRGVATGARRTAGPAARVRSRPGSCAAAGILTRRSGYPRCRFRRQVPPNPMPIPKAAAPLPPPGRRSLADAFERRADTVFAKAAGEPRVSGVLAQAFQGLFILGTQADGHVAEPGDLQAIRLQGCLNIRDQRRLDVAGPRRQSQHRPLLGGQFFHHAGAQGLENLLACPIGDQIIAWPGECPPISKSLRSDRSPTGRIRRIRGGQLPVRSPGPRCCRWDRRRAG